MHKERGTKHTITDRALPDNHECGTITSTAARFIALIGGDAYKRRPGQTTHAQAAQQEQQLSPDTRTTTMGKGKKLIPKKKPEAASVDIFAEEEEESSDEDVGDDSQDQNTIDANPDIDVATPPLHRRTVVRTEQEAQDDDLTQMDSQELTDPADATESSEQRGNPNKRKRTYHIIPEDKEVSVVDWYRDQEFLYNKKMRAYRDRDRKSKAWEDKARSLDVDGEY